MSSYPLLKTRQAVKNFFYRTGYVKFTLYAGHENTPSKSLHVSKDDEASQDAQWEILENIFKDHDWKGDYFLFMTDSKNGTGGGKQERIRLDGTGETTTATATINGIPNGYVSLEQVSGIVEAAMMRKENEELKAKIAGGLSPQHEPNRLWDLVEKIIDEKDNEHPIVQGIADIGKGIKYLLFKAANGGRSENFANPDIKDDKKEQNTEGGKKWKFGKMESVFKHIENLFPDDEPQEVCVALIKQLYGFKGEERAFFIDELKKTMAAEAAKKEV